MNKVLDKIFGAMSKDSRGVNILVINKVEESIRDR